MKIVYELAFLPFEGMEESLTEEQKNICRIKFSCFFNGFLHPLTNGCGSFFSTQKENGRVIGELTIERKDDEQ